MKARLGMSTTGVGSLEIGTWRMTWVSAGGLAIFRIRVAAVYYIGNASVWPDQTRQDRMGGMANWRRERESKRSWEKMPPDKIRLT